MSLVADYGSDSDGSAISYEAEQPRIVAKTEPVDSPSSSSSEEAVEEKPKPSAVKLPTPEFTRTPRDAARSSVFGNPFREAEMAERAMLQRHVQMVNAADDAATPPLINGKKICWNHRKGRCRFGHACKFAHDSDLRKTDAQLDDEREAARAQSEICRFGGSNHGVPIDDEGRRSEPKSKRKRPGLSQQLAPGKKVMKQYFSNKS